MYSHIALYNNKHQHLRLKIKERLQRLNQKWLIGFGHESLIPQYDTRFNTWTEETCTNVELLVLPCVASWKPVFFSNFLNAKLLRTIASYIDQK